MRRGLEPFRRPLRNEQDMRDLELNFFLNLSGHISCSHGGLRERIIAIHLPIVESIATVTVGGVDLKRHDLQLSIRFAERNRALDVAG